MAVSAPTAPPSGRAAGAPPRPRLRPHRHAVPAALAAISVAYLATRLALVWRLPPFWDEAGYGEWANGAAQGAGTRWLSMLEGKEPLTSWLGALWVHAGAQYLTAVRLVSVTAGAVSLAMLWLVGRRFSTSVALVAMALYAALPLFVVHDSLGLMEPTLTATSLCALYLTIRLGERPSLDVALLLGLATGAGLLVKQNGRFALVMVPLGLLVFDWARAGRARRLAGWAGGVAVAGAVCAVCYSVLMLSPSWPTYLRARGQFHRPIGDVLSDPWTPLSANGRDLFPALAGYVGPVLLVLVLVGVWVSARRDRRLAGLVALWGVLPFLWTLLLIVSGGYARYWHPALAPLTIPMAAGLLWLVGQAGRRVAHGWPRALATAGALGIAIVPPGVLLARVAAHPATAHYPSLDDSQYVTSWAAGSGWKAVAESLDARTQGARFALAYDRARPLWVYLTDPGRVEQIPIGTPAAPGADYLVKNFDEPFTPGEQRAFRLIGRFARPRHGQPILLYAHR